MNDYLSEVFGDGGLFASRFPGYEMREGQVALARMVDEAMRDGRHALGEGPCGCHVAGQGILLVDGAVKAVEDVVVGDQLMGPMGEPRNVLALARGRQETVEIRPIKGVPWRVNLDHVLTLVRIDNDEVIDVRVRDWMDWSHTQKALHKLFRSPVVFAPTPMPLPLDPYFLGVLLGDGSLSIDGHVAVTKPDLQIRAAAIEVAHTLGLRVRSDDQVHHLVGPIGNKHNSLLQILRELGLMPIRCEDRFIPAPYKVASLHERRALLAGLLDTDGSLTGRACYDYISKSRKLAEGVVYVARSIGLAAYLRPCLKRCQTGHESTYFRVSISGNTHTVPCRIPRKMAPVRVQRKNALRTGFEVVPTGVVEPYFGFSLDSDGRYLLDDFTVTHNTGKSVAYAVPAIHHAHHEKKRVVIATANIALQEQLVRKDLPMLASVLPWPFTFALLKGRNNYACLARMAESEARGELRGLHDADQQRQFDDVRAWAEATKTGDVSELAFIPQARVWSRFSVGSEECEGDGCPFRDDCYAERAKATAQDADLVVTNYHLLFAHLAVRQATGQDLVLPAFDLLVLDEAHEAAEIAREFFGFTLSEHTFGRLASAAADLGNKPLAGALRQEALCLFATLADHARSPRYKKRLKAPGFANDESLQRALGELVALAKDRCENEFAAKKERATARNLAKNATTVAARLSEGLAQANPACVYWLDVDDKGRTKLRGKPIDVSELLRAELFARCPSVSLVSATLTTSGTFDFVRRELGVPEGALEVVAETPFDFASQALLVVPERLPDPRDADFIDEASRIFQLVVDACDGRTLGLFTSYRNLNAVYERLDGREHRVLRQGELPRAELTRLFKEDVGSILLGTESFWTGIDVAGEALTGLVIDKLPFPSPDDPVIDAICERDPRAFDNYLLPRAIITLRQGMGRLIRCKTDVGVAVLLDKRIAEKGYGKKFLKSLPPLLATRRVENITRFLEEAAHARAR